MFYLPQAVSRVTQKSTLKNYVLLLKISKIIAKSVVIFPPVLPLDRLRRLMSSVEIFVYSMKIIYILTICYINCANYTY
jgi:hypothetical protein